MGTCGQDGRITSPISLGPVVPAGRGGGGDRNGPIVGKMAGLTAEVHRVLKTVLGNMGGSGT